jgi:hypothetical protein
VQLTLALLAINDVGRTAEESRKTTMSAIELLITILAIIGLAALRLGIPVMFMWLLARGLRYAQAVLP